MKRILIIIGAIFIATFTTNVTSAHATSGACSWHNGVNCSAGPDWDGSEICNDGWRDSSVLYSNTIMCQHYNQTPQTHEELFVDSSIKLLNIALGALQVQLDYEGKIIESTSKFYSDLFKAAASEGITQANIDQAFSAKESSKGGIAKNKITVIATIEGIKNQITAMKDDYVNGSYSVDINFIKSAYNEIAVVIDYMINSLKIDNKTNEAIDSLHQQFLNDVSQYLEKTCSTGQYLGSDNKCYCSNNYGWSSLQNKCIPPSAWCSELYGDHTEYDLTTAKCLCADGYYNSGGRCLEIGTSSNTSSAITTSATDTGNSCTDEQILVNGKCECKYGYEASASSHGDYLYCYQIPRTQLVTAAPFADVTMIDGNLIAISYLKDNNIIGGYEDGTFQPKKTINRAELLKILIGSSLPDSSYGNCFSDVKDEWFAPYICYAKGRGWIQGYADGTFKPAQTVNRVEALKMAIEVFGLSSGNAVTTNPFPDTDHTEWFAGYVQDANEKGLLDFSTRFFAPGDGMTRGAISEIIYRALAVQKFGSEKFSYNLDEQMLKE